MPPKKSGWLVIMVEEMNDKLENSKEQIGKGTLVINWMAIFFLLPIVLLFGFIVIILSLEGAPYDSLIGFAVIFALVLLIFILAFIAKFEVTASSYRFNHWLLPFIPFLHQTKNIRGITIIWNFVTIHTDNNWFTFKMYVPNIQNFKRELLQSNLEGLSDENLHHLKSDA